MFFSLSLATIILCHWLMAMEAILATIANSRQAIVDINREAGRNKLINPLIYHLILNASMVALLKKRELEES
jgi:hypothetical protein